MEIFVPFRRCFVLSYQQQQDATSLFTRIFREVKNDIIPNQWIDNYTEIYIANSKAFPVISDALRFRI